MDLAEVFRHLPGPFQKISWELVWLVKMGLASLRSPMVSSGRLEAIHVEYFRELNGYIYWHALVSVPEVPLLAKKCE